MALTHDDEPFAEMQRRFDAQYERIDALLVGEGTYGQVFRAREVSTGRIVAHKKIKLDAEEEGVPATAVREIALLKELNHENVVQLLDFFCSPTRLTLVFEFVDNDLKKFMKGRGRPLDEMTIKSFSFQLCQGLEYCHANSVIHRDLKPQNLLIDSKLSLKIADFGLARAYSLPVPKYTHEVVTVWYRPPEILLGGTFYSVPVDIWSTGCIVNEMATGRPLFCGDSEIDTIFKIFQTCGTPTTEQWPGLADLPDFKPTFPKWKHKGWENVRNTRAQLGPMGIDLLEQCFVYDPAGRISARKALSHPYFAELELPTR